MSDPNPASAPRPGAIDRVKSGAAVLGAVAGAVTALYGVYEKVRSEAKQYTAASYNTLAPQMNQIGEALKQLQQENQQLREIVAGHQNQPRLATRPPPATTRRNGKRPAAGGSAAAQPAAAATPPAATPDPGPAAAATTPAGTPATPPPAGAPAAEPPAAGEPPRAAADPPPSSDPVGGLLNTVGRTREAIDSLRKVPENFENVLGKKK